MKEEGEEEKEKRKRKEEEKKMHQASTAARLCRYKTSPPQAIPAAGVAIFKGHFTIHQITKKTVVLWVFLATVRPCDPLALIPVNGLKPKSGGAIFGSKNECSTRPWGRRALI
jgi:hypothetical protein